MEKKAVEEKDNTSNERDISNLTGGVKEGVWLKVVEGIRVKLKSATPEYRKKLLKRCSAIRFKQHRRYDELDDIKFDSLLAKHVVVDWEMEQDGKPFPCTSENKEWLMNKSTVFNDFVQDATMHLERYQKEQKEEEAQN